MSIEAMETTFTLKDVFYIGGLIVTGLTAWFKMQRDKDRMETKIEALDEKDKAIKEELLVVKSSKKAMKKELETMMKEKEQTLHLRIDRVRDDNIKSYDKLEQKITDVEKKMDQNTQTILEAISKR